MKRVLAASVREERSAASRTTQKALLSRGLVEADGQFTSLGWKQAVVLLPLEQQCAILGIGFERLANVLATDEPEIDAWRHFASLGWSGGFCEGGPILLLIRSAALNTLARLNTFESRQDACTRFTEAQLTILRSSAPEIIGAIRSSTHSSVVSCFEEIYASLTVQECYPHLSTEAMGTLFNAIGPERLASIAEALFEDPYAYRSGWPDLTLARDDTMQWIEIKTTDKLHMSQVNTIRRMKSLLPGSVRVVQLTSSGKE